MEKEQLRDFTLACAQRSKMMRNKLISQRRDPPAINSMDLVVATTAGTLAKIVITPEVERALLEKGPLPGYFLGPTRIVNYILAPQFETKLKRKYGDREGRDMAIRLRSILDSYKTGRSIQDQKKMNSSLVLDLE